MRKWWFSPAEDRLYNDVVEHLIRRAHGFKIESAVRHMVVDGKEIDVVIICQRRNKVWTIGMELKLRDVLGGLKQSLERMKSFNYFYLVLGTDAVEMQRALGRRRLSKIIDAGLGVILWRPSPHIWVKGGLNRSPTWRPTTLSSRII